MSSSQSLVAFEGAAFENGEMDVRDFAPAHLALGEVIQAANRALKGDRGEARLKVRATNRGSFEALLSVDVSFLRSIGDMLDVLADNPDRTFAAQALLALIIGGGAVAGTTARVGYTGMLFALKLLRGKMGMLTVSLPQLKLITPSRRRL